MLALVLMFCFLHTSILDKLQQIDLDHPKQTSIGMPPSAPTAQYSSREYISESDATVFRRFETLQRRIAKARMWLSVLAILSLIDAPAALIQNEYVRVATFYTLILALIAIPIIVYINWCKTLQFAFRHKVGVIKLSRQRISVFRPLYRNELLLEIGMWLVFTPPYLRQAYEWTNIFDIGCFLRLYALLLYYGAQHYSTRVSCQAITRLSRRTLNLHFVLASALYSNPALFLATALTVFWSAMTLIFAKIEGRSIGDSFYFVWVTSAFIGFGDVYPRTFGGQVISILCGSFGMVVIGFATHPLSNRTGGFRPRNNLYTMVVAVALLLQRREAAAVVLAWSFRYARARREEKTATKQTLAQTVRRQFTASELHKTCAAFARRRHYAVHHVRIYDKMMEEVANTKFLDVFSSHKDKSTTLLLQYLSSVAREVPVSIAAQEDLSSATPLDGEAAAAAVLAASNSCASITTERPRLLLNSEQPPGTSSFDDSMVAESSLLDGGSNDTDMNDMVATRLEMKLAYLTSLLREVAEQQQHQLLSPPTSQGSSFAYASFAGI